MGLERVVITGAGGALGTALMQSLKSDNRFEVLGFTRDPQSLRLRVGDAPSLRFMGNEEMEFDELGTVDVFVHCAYPRTNAGASFAEGLRTCLDMMLAASRATVGASILISSQSVYDPNRQCPADEDSAPMPIGGYAVGKYMMELVFDRVFQNEPHTAIRLGSLLGESVPERAVNRMIKQVIGGQDLKIIRSDQAFDLLDVEDAADAFHRMMTTDPTDWKHVYNLGSGRTYSLVEIGSTVQTICGIALGREIVMRVTDAEASGNSGLNSRRFYQDFDWVPSHSLASTVHRIAIEEIAEAHGNESLAEDRGEGTRHV